MRWVHYSFVSFIDAVLDRAPQSINALVKRHHELIKFALVGAFTMIVDGGIYYPLVFGVLDQKPTIAKTISGFVAMCVSYLLNSRWAFKNRGGHHRTNEVLLFLIISVLGVFIAAAPMFFANNVFHLRHDTGSVARVVLDFFINYIVGVGLGMVFRFWALRRFAFPHDMTVIEADSVERPGRELESEPEPSNSRIATPKI